MLCWACPVEVGLSAHVVDNGIFTLGNAPALAFIFAVPVAKDDMFRAEVAVAGMPVKLCLLILATLRLLEKSASSSIFRE
jgi:hypothetical protein